MKNKEKRSKSRFSWASFLTLAVIVVLSACSSSELIRQNEFLMADGRIDEAVSNLEKALISEPDDHEILYLLAQALFQKERYDQAYQEIHKAILLEPQIDSYRLLAGKIAYADKDYFKATNQLINALLLNNTMLEGYFLLAKTYQEIGNIEEAIGQLETAVSIEPMFFEAQLLLHELEFNKQQQRVATEQETDERSKVNTATGQTAESNELSPELAVKELIESFHETLRSNPKSVEGAILLTEMYLFLGETPRARQVLTRWLEENGYSSEKIVLRLAEIEYQNGKFAEANAYLKQLTDPSLDAKILMIKLDWQTDPGPGYEEQVNALLEEHPGEKELLLMKGQLLLDRGELIEAEKILQQCIDSDPDHSACYFHLSQVLDAQKDSFGAQWALDKAFELAPLNATVRIEYAERLIENRQYDEAEAVLDHPSMSDTDPTVAFLKGRIAKVRSDYQTAVELFNVAKNQIYSVLIEAELAEIDIRQGKYQSAEHRLKKIEASAPGHLEIAIKKAMLFMKTGRLEMIPPLLTPHVETPQGKGRVHLLLADALLQLDQLEQAQTILEDGLQRWPRHVELTQALTLYQGLTGDYDRAIERLLDIQAYSHKYEELFHYRLLFYYFKAGRKEDFKAYYKEHNRL